MPRTRRGLLAARDVLGHPEPVALDRLVVAHQPRQILGRVLARLGRKAAQPPVHLHPHPSQQLGVAVDRLVEPRVEVLAVALEAQNEGLVVDAGAEERHRFEQDVDELGE